MALRRLLVDKSAYVRGVPPPERDDELCLCAITRLEILYSARSARDYAQLERDLSEFRDLRMDVDALAEVLAFAPRRVSNAR